MPATVFSKTLTAVKCPPVCEHVDSLPELQSGGYVEQHFSIVVLDVGVCVSSPAAEEPGDDVSSDRRDEE